jgi:hypothetical protein
MAVHDVEPAAVDQMIEAGEPPQIGFSVYVEAMRGNTLLCESRDEMVLPRQEVRSLVLETVPVTAYRVLHEQALGPARSESFREP